MDVIVTGASRGLGRAIAEEFARHGHNLYLSSLNGKRLYDAVQEMTNEFPTVTIKGSPFDLSKKDQAKKFGTWCLDNCTPDVLVNNAGSFAGANVHDEEEGALEEMIETNL